MAGIVIISRTVAVILRRECFLERHLGFWLVRLLILAIIIIDAVVRAEYLYAMYVESIVGGMNIATKFVGFVGTANFDLVLMNLLIEIFKTSWQYLQPI